MATSTLAQSDRPVITITAGGTYTALTPIKIGSALFGVPQSDAVSGDLVGLRVRGIEALAKTAGGGITFALGDRVYWNAGTSLCTATTTDDEIGVCAATAVNGASTVDVYLNGRVDSFTSDAVLKALFDANTVLAANADNTPAAVTVAEQRIVGRITGGNITALTGAQVATIVPAAAQGTVGVMAIATTAEVNTGTNDTKAISALALNGSAPVMAVTNMTGTAAGIDSDATSHAASNGSSHTWIDQTVVSGAAPTFTGTNFTGIPTGAVAQATTAALGAVALATTAEVDTGTDANKAITPDSLNGSAPVIAVTNMTGTAAGIDSDATSHAASNGSSHTWIDQTVVSGAAPTFTGTNFTGIPAAGVTGTALVAASSIYQLATIPNGATTVSVAAGGGQTNGKPVMATVFARGTNPCYVVEAIISGGNLEIEVSADPGVGGVDIATWTDNR